MISYLFGTIQHKSVTAVVLQTAGGVGYLVHMTRACVARLTVGQELSVHTYLRVTDSALELFGFHEVEEKEFFELLLSVSGIGPKSAMNVLSLGSVTDISAAIGRADATYLSAVQGIGKKTAERLCVELKTKVTIGNSQKEMVDSMALADVVDALVSMGYSKEEARTKVSALATEGKNEEDILKEALRNA